MRVQEKEEKTPKINHPATKIPKQTAPPKPDKKPDGEGIFSLCQQLKQSPRFPQVIVSTPRHNIFVPFDELKETGREKILEKFHFYPY